MTASEFRQHPLYATYKGMLRRCYDETHSAYSNYGGRGVTVCASWRDSPVNFISDMGAKSFASHTLDRVDSTGGYTPENCRWASKTTQARNHRLYARNKTGVTGVVFDLSRGKWAARIAVKRKTINLGRFDSFFAAVCARKSAEIKIWVS